ncbi:arylsulfatase [bacterium]|nr:arylsulfatase [bacterium]
MKSLTRRDFIRIGSSAAAAAGAGISFGTRSASAQTQPNILFLMADQHRGDCLGCDGNRAIRTPNIDRIAGEGAHFRHAYSSTPTCTPARSGILTGLSPWHHGMLGYGRVADHYPVELPQTMRDAGYRTLGIGKMHWYPQRNLHGFHKTILDESSRVETEGFESDYRAFFREHAPKGMAYDVTGIGWNDYRTAVYVPPEELHPTFWTAQTAVDFIRDYRNPEPFFLKVSFARPHSPYDPPKRFMEAYREDDMPAPVIGDWAAKYAPADPADFSLWHGDLGIGQARKSRRGYYGSVSFIDEQIGRILGALEQRGFLDNTFILFTADHGDMTGDHNLWRKSYAYESSAHIPFIVRPPKGMFDKAGVTFDQPVELRDVLPTFLDAAGQPVPGHLDGRSVLDIFRGKSDSWREVIDMEHDVCYDPSNHWNALTDGRYKYIYHAMNGGEQLFDLYNDPGELHDLSMEPGNRGKVREWHARMVQHLAERGEPFVVNGDLAPRPERMLYSPHYPKS